MTTYEVRPVGGFAWMVYADGQEFAQSSEQEARWMRRVLEVHGLERGGDLILNESTYEDGLAIEAGDWCRACGAVTVVDDDQLCQGCFEYDADAVRAARGE
jgi:hypothetical protein